MLVKIEVAVQQHVVPVEWLHRGESAMERYHMTTLSLADHDTKAQDHIKAESREAEAGDDEEARRKQQERLAAQLLNAEALDGMP